MDHTNEQAGNKPARSFQILNDDPEPVDKDGNRIELTGQTSVATKPTPPSAPSPIQVRGQYVQKAMDKLPVTAEGLPIGYYRADMIQPQALPFSITQEERTQHEKQMLVNAFVELNYDQGFPQLPNLEPFWSKMEHEPGMAYGAFQSYLSMLDLKGARTLHELALDEELIHLFDAQGATPSEMRDTLRNYHNMYCWRFRARAFDLFREAVQRSQRVQRMHRTQDRHYTMATTLLSKVQDRMNQPDFMDELSGKELIDLLKACVAIERVSVGLPASGPLSEKERPTETTFEAILREVTESAKTGKSMEDTLSKTRAAASTLIDKTLRDPSTVRVVQEVIVKMTQLSQETPDPRGPQGRGRTFDNDTLNQVDTDENVFGQ